MPQKKLTDIPLEQLAQLYGERRMNLQQAAAAEKQRKAREEMQRLQRIDKPLKDLVPGAVGSGMLWQLGGAGFSGPARVAASAEGALGSPMEWWAKKESENNPDLALASTAFSRRGIAEAVARATKIQRLHDAAQNVYKPTPAGLGLGVTAGQLPPENALNPIVHKALLSAASTPADKRRVVEGLKNSIERSRHNGLFPSLWYSPNLDASQYPIQQIAATLKKSGEFISGEGWKEQLPVYNSILATSPLQRAQEIVAKIPGAESARVQKALQGLQQDTTAAVAKTVDDLHKEALEKLKTPISRRSAFKGILGGAAGAMMEAPVVISQLSEQLFGFPIKTEKIAARKLASGKIVPEEGMADFIRYREKLLQELAQLKEKELEGFPAAYKKRLLQELKEARAAKPESYIAHWTDMDEGIQELIPTPYRSEKEYADALVRVKKQGIREDTPFDPTSIDAELQSTIASNAEMRAVDFKTRVLREQQEKALDGLDVLDNQLYNATSREAQKIAEPIDNLNWQDIRFNQHPNPMMSPLERDIMLPRSVTKKGIRHSRNISSMQSKFITDALSKGDAASAWRALRVGSDLGYGGFRDDAIGSYYLNAEGTPSASELLKFLKDFKWH